MERFEIKQAIVDMLREWREAEGNAYNGLPRIIRTLKESHDVEVPELELYDWNNETGIMYELEDEGLVMCIHSSSGPCYLAEGEMDWG